VRLFSTLPGECHIFDIQQFVMASLYRCNGWCSSRYNLGRLRTSTLEVAMAPSTQYKLISANSAEHFQRELDNNTGGGWKPILLTSSALHDQFIMAAILEGPVDE
jgi:hypothetical protein